ncbi:MAG: hypothetical protein WCX47_01940 [Bacilli bacterium]|jgi:hypothetical protein|nr:hypothetical protein [Bacilli bacterium]
MILIDSQKETEKYQRKKFRSVLFFSLISFSIALIIALGIIFSPPQFIWLLIILLILFIVYSIGALLFLIGPFKETIVKAKIFWNMSSSSIFDEELTLVKIDDSELHSYQGLVSLQMTFSYSNEEKESERTLYILLPSKSKMEIGKRYSVHSSNNLILSYEEIL